MMSEKSFTMDTVYSGMVLDSDMPSEPLEVLAPFSNTRSLVRIVFSGSTAQRKSIRSIDATQGSKVVLG